VQVPKPLVGFVIGRNGEHINNIQNTCGVRLQFQNDIPGTDYRIATIAGPGEACVRAKKMVEDIVAERCGGIGTQGGQPMLERQQMGGFKPRLELPNPTGPGVQTVQFPVPSGKCGLVIGKGTRLSVFEHVLTSSFQKWDYEWKGP
jgi:far upstream element-binding protein